MDDEGNFNGYSPEDELTETALPTGTVPVVEEYGEQEKQRLFKLRLQRINNIRKEQGLPEMTEDEFVALCRPKQITDESICLLQKDSAI